MCYSRSRPDEIGFSGAETGDHGVFCFCWDSNILPSEIEMFAQHRPIQLNATKPWGESIRAIGICLFIHIFFVGCNFRQQHTTTAEEKRKNRVNSIVIRFLYCSNEICADIFSIETNKNGKMEMRDSFSFRTVSISTISVPFFLFYLSPQVTIGFEFYSTNSHFFFLFLISYICYIICVCVCIWSRFLTIEHETPFAKVNNSIWTDERKQWRSCADTFFCCAIRRVLLLKRENLRSGDVEPLKRIETDWWENGKYSFIPK